MNAADYLIDQECTYQGKDWWVWSIWIEATDKNLDLIQNVIYILHPTFKDPVRTITDRSSKFRLNTEGWGIFTIYAKLTSKDGETISLTHELSLVYPDGTQTQK